MQSLPKPGDPLVMNGEVLEPEDPDEEVYYNDGTVPPPTTAVPFKFYRPVTKRVLSDLRAPTHAVNVAAVVLSYTLLGISDAEICISTGLDGAEVMKVRDSRVYAECFGNIMQELINANSEYIECRLAAYSGMALSNVAGIAKTAKNQAVKLSANNSILDRAGFRPQDQAGRTQNGMNELHIVITTPNDVVAKDIKFTAIEKDRTNGHSPE
jgi:hypothetical protein